MSLDSNEIGNNLPSGFAMHLFARCLLLISGIAFTQSALAQWTITPRTVSVLDTSQVSGVAELSGVTYLGRGGGERQRFVAVQDSGNQLVEFNFNILGDGSFSGATATETTALSPGFDFEGAAYTNPTRNSVFLSEENTPAVREYDLTTGTLLQTVTMPAVFNNIRGNRGLESLTRSVDGTIMWTANEEALTIDGPVATANNGTTVRLQQLLVDGNSVTPGPQFAYLVDPVHAASTQSQSGLADLTLLPDGTLLALERSAASAFPAYESRIYQIGFGGATDVNTAHFDGGLLGGVFTSVSKTLLWSGQIGGLSGSGENLEGLTLVPKLQGGWALVGVVDDGDPVSNNTITSFELALSSCSLAGDFNCNGTVDGLDYNLWKNTFGSSLNLFADGNTNGRIDAADYTVWLDNLGASSGSGLADIIPEPATYWLILVGGTALLTGRR